MKLGPNQKKWIKALRSGDYKQGQEYLKKNVDGTAYYCCLGVMCDLDPEVDYSLVEKEIPEEYTANKWGLYSTSGMNFDFDLALTELNDDGHTFAEIADLIEADPDKFFKHSY